MNENNTVYQARMHWIIFLWPVLAFFAATYTLFKWPYLGLSSYIMIGFSLVWLLVTWLTYSCTTLVVTKNQVILSTGILMRQTMDVPLSKIESIDIRQSVLGSLFHYGTLIITGTGGSRQYVTYLNKPLTCRRYIEQSLHTP
jgi:uncharacterized membrane protein YdbT with pleckstrin-like domain